MRIIVTGSRSWSDVMVLRQALAWLAYDVVVRDGGSLVVVHGACPTGADAMASEWVAHWPGTGWSGVTEERHPADWEQFGKRAGPIRNEAMIKAGADLVLAFPLPGGKGTQHAIRLAREAGIPVRVWGEE